MSDLKPAEASAQPFAVRDCALITLATGIQAQNLKEFREGLQRVPQGSIYHHFWGRLLRAQFDEPEFNNDFASWVFRGLHDLELAERLSMVIPTDFEALEQLRQEVVEVVEERLDESELAPWSMAGQPFIFFTPKWWCLTPACGSPIPPISSPICRPFPRAAYFYHFIDARPADGGAAG